MTVWLLLACVGHMTGNPCFAIPNLPSEAECDSLKAKISDANLYGHFRVYDWRCIKYETRGP